MGCHKAIPYNSGVKFEFLLHSIVQATSWNLVASILVQKNLNIVTSIDSFYLYSATTMWELITRPDHISFSRAIHLEKRCFPTSNMVWHKLPALKVNPSAHVRVLPCHLGHSSTTMLEHPDSSGLERGLLWLTAHGTVHHNRKAKAAGLKAAGHIAFILKKLKCKEGMDDVNFLPPFIWSRILDKQWYHHSLCAGLPTSIKAVKTFPYRHAQRSSLSWI